MKALVSFHYIEGRLYSDGNLGGLTALSGLIYNLRASSTSLFYGASILIVTLLLIMDYFCLLDYFHS